MVNKVDKVFWCIACEEFLDGMFLLSSILHLIFPPFHEDNAWQRYIE